MLSSKSSTLSGSRTFNAVKILDATLPITSSSQFWFIFETSVKLLESKIYLINKNTFVKTET